MCVIVWPEITLFLIFARRRFSRSPVLVRRTPPGCEILVGFILVRVRVVRGVLHGRGLLGGQCVRCARV